MKKKRLLTLFGSICLVLVLVALLLPACAKEAPPAPVPAPAPPVPAPPAPAPPKPTIPRIIKMSVYEVGSSSFIRIALLAEAILEKYGTKIRFLPGGTDVGRLLPLRTGEVELMQTAGGGWQAREALFAPFTWLEWGPQQLHSLWLIGHPGGAFMLRGDSDIHTLKDLKGRRGALCWAVPAGYAYTYAGLAFAGLTKDDVEWVECPTYLTTEKAVLEGRADFMMPPVNSLNAIAMETMPCGLRWLGFPHDDKEGWERLRADCRWFVPVTATFGAGGISEENPLEGAGYAYEIAVYPDADPNVTYFMTKAIHECYDMYAPKDKKMKRHWGIESCLKYFKYGVTPFHEGSVQYFKDIGVWTDELQEVQEKMLTRQERLREFWNEAVDEAITKGIKAKDFSEFWAERRRTFKD